MKGKPKSPAGKKAAWRLSPRELAVFGGLLVALAVGIFFFVRSPAPEGDLDAFLIGQGFTVNPGFAATFRPGDVIQIEEPDGKGGHCPLARPLLFLKREDCFPGRHPDERSFALPDTSGRRSGSLGIDGRQLGRLLPGLQLAGKGVRSYSLAIENPRAATFSKGDLSESFAPTCVERFDKALTGGDRQEWFGTVIEAVVADAMTLTVEWGAGAEGAARTRLANAARHGLQAPGGKVETAVDSREKTVLRAKGPVVLGYRYRPIEGVL